MKPARMDSARGIPALVPALVVSLAIPFGAARAEVPGGPPTFSNPLVIDSPFFPFQPGGMKVYSGSDRGTKAEVLDLYLTGTRTFRWNGQDVQTRILREEAYEFGELVERSDNYFAQADDGTAYYWGEVVDNYEGGVIVDHGGSWLVGGPTLPSDPPETGNAPDPALFMLANPELGDVFKPEDLFPIVDETAEVVNVDVDVITLAGKFDDAIAVEESSRLTPSTELKWYAPGVGVVKIRARGETMRLEFSTLAQPQDD